MAGMGGKGDNFIELTNGFFKNVFKMRIDNSTLEKRSWLRMIFAVVIGITSLSFHPVTSRHEETDYPNSVIKEDWHALFDGKTLNGWHALPGGTWNVEDGILVGRSDPKEERHGILISDKQFKNFEIEVVYKAVKGNSGLYFRAEEVGGLYGVLGFQAEIDPVADAGGLYETGGREWVSRPSEEDVRKYFKPGDWNTMRV